MNEIPSALAEQLGGTYDLASVIGQGGMSTVYLARDVRHERDVAIKVMRDDLSTALSTERFLREIRISASLTHPHILTLIDSGEAAGLLYYVTPFIGGESLRVQLRGGPLDVETVFRITREIGDALAYAHRNDVIHRDIKPENILMAEGHAVVADFGIAKAISHASDEHLTRTGFPLGTVGYMSPEQAAGGSDLNHTTDVYSLACVCYEMIVGVPPGRWIQESEIENRRFVTSLPEYREHLNELPAHAEMALLKAMAIHPEVRFESATSFCDAFTEKGIVELYGTADVERIIGDAARLDAIRPTADPGMSLQSIEDLGSEVGIPREMVRKAAAVPAPAGTVSRETGFLKWPLKIVAEREIPGEIYGSDYVFALDEIRRVIDEPGQPSTLGNAFEWRTSNPGVAGMRDVQVTITPRTGKTYVNIREKIRSDQVISTVAGLEVALAIGGITAGIVSGGITWAIPAILGAAGILTIGARRWVEHTTARKEGTLGDLADRIANHIRESRSRI